MPLLPPPGLPLFLPVQGSACTSLYKHLSWRHTGVCMLAVQPLASSQECTVYRMWGGPVPSQPMVEAVLLQIPPSIRKVLWVRVANHRNRIVYTEHVLLHSFVLFLLNLIQCPYHGIIVAFVTKHLLHVYQQVLHRDILAFIKGAGSFTGVPVETGKDMRAHTGLIILLKEGIHIKPPECVYITSAPGSVNLKISISNLAGANHFFSLLPLQSLHQC